MKATCNKHVDAIVEMSNKDAEMNIHFTSHSNDWKKVLVQSIHITNCQQEEVNQASPYC